MMRLRIAFGLRWLFVVVGLVALPLAWYTGRQRSLLRRQAAIERVEELGGFVHFADNHRAPGQAYPYESWGDLLFSDATAFVKVDGVVFGRASEVSDNDLSILNEFATIQFLRLDSVRLTEDCLVHLDAVPDVTELHIARLNLSNRAVSRIAKMNQLQEIEIAPSTPDDIRRALRDSLRESCNIHD